MHLGIFPGIYFEPRRLTVVALYLWLFFRFLVRDASGLVPAPVQGLLLDAGSLEVTVDSVSFFSLGIYPLFCCAL